MASQDGPSAAGQVGAILQTKANVISKYRNRLIAAGLIESAGYGKVDFAIPGLRQYLRLVDRQKINFWLLIRRGKGCGWRPFPFLSAPEALKN